MILKLAIITLAILIPNIPTPAIETIYPYPELIDLKTGVLREASAYNGVVEQCDGNPCEAADGSNICERYAAGECLIAGNFGKLGTRYYVSGFGECTLVDRMNRRYTNHVDIFFGQDIKGAIKFGRQKLFVKLLN